MFIVSPDQKSVINLNVFSGMGVIDNAIIAKPQDEVSRKILIATYQSTERAEEVFKTMLLEIFNHDREMECYYMPKE